MFAHVWKNKHDLKVGKWFLEANVDIWNHQNKDAPTPKGSRPYFDSAAPHIRMATISSVKQSKTNVTHLSRRNKATSASDHRPSRSLSSLQCWKADPIFTRVLLLARAVTVWDFLLPRWSSNKYRGLAVNRRNPQITPPPPLLPEISNDFWPRTHAACKWMWKLIIIK